MSVLLSEPRMSDREKVCARKWMEAALDKEDPDLATYWQNKGLEARLERLAGEDSQPIPEPPIPAPKKPKKAACDLCGATTCTNSACLI